MRAEWELMLQVHAAATAVLLKRFTLKTDRASKQTFWHSGSRFAADAEGKKYVFCRKIISFSRKFLL